MGDNCEVSFASMLNVIYRSISLLMRRRLSTARASLFYAKLGVVFAHWSFVFFHPTSTIHPTVTICIIGTSVAAMQLTQTVHLYESERRLASLCTVVVHGGNEKRQM